MPIRTFLQFPVLRLIERKALRMQPINEAVEQDVEITQTPELNASDRCDVCGAQAYIRVALSTGELMFCSHHGNEKKAKLEPIAVSWHDETEKLLAR